MHITELPVDMLGLSPQCVTNLNVTFNCADLI